MHKSLDYKIRRFQRSVLDGIVRKNPSLGLDHRAELLTSRFEVFLPPKSRILDVGGGWGFYAHPLEKRGHFHTVLEVVNPGFQRAPVVMYDSTKPMPFLDKSFDVSLFVTVLHHIPNPAAVLLEALRVTSKRIIVVEDLYHHRLGRLWTVLRDQFYNCEFYGHPRQFKKKEEWAKFFEDLGVSVHYSDEFYTHLAGVRILNGIFALDVRS